MTLRSICKAYMVTRLNWMTSDNYRTVWCAHDRYAQLTNMAMATDHTNYSTQAELALRTVWTVSNNTTSVIIPVGLCHSLNYLTTIYDNVYWALHGTAPWYLSDRLSHVADMPYRNQLLTNLLSGCRILSQLADDITSAPSLTVFWHKPKTQLFRQSYPDIIM